MSHNLPPALSDLLERLRSTTSPEEVERITARILQQAASLPGAQQAFVYLELSTATEVAPANMVPAPPSRSKSPAARKFLLGAAGAILIGAGLLSSRGEPAPTPHPVTLPPVQAEAPVGSVSGTRGEILKRVEALIDSSEQHMEGEAETAFFGENITDYEESWAMEGEGEVEPEPPTQPDSLKPKGPGL